MSLLVVNCRVRPSISDSYASHNCGVNCPMNESANCILSASIRLIFRTAATLLLLSGTGDSAFGQTVRKIEVSDDGTVEVVEEAVAAPAAAPAKKEGGNKSKEDDKSNDKKKDSDKSGDDEKKEDEGGPVKRPTMSGTPAADIKDEATVNEKGYVSFNLRGQPWEVVLQWIADSSNLSFDWQELPGDTLNLTTTKSYPLDEARDMINRHLLARGYTMVLYGEFLSVMKLSDVKSSLVPRVTAEELKTLPRHTLCKMSFDLQWLIADEVMQEVAPLLSKAGKISKMSRTNRLEIMDTAGTLQEIQQILSEEQSDTGQEQLVKTFHLENRRAEEVIVLLRDLLGVDPPPGGGGGGFSSSGMSQMANVMKQMTQQLQRMGNNAAKGGGGREPTKTRLVLNPRENMILAQAMPDQMAIIEKAIEQIDVPVKQTNSLLNNINRIKVYRLETFDPQTLVDMLTELGDLAPGTVLKVDDDKKSIVAFATLADHLTITTLVEKLDQSARSVEVIPLRRLEADYVAGTIRALMAPPEKQQNNSRYSYYSRYSSSSQQNKEDDKKFKVEADIENNRLLVYANKVEMEEIHTLLQKLGEIPDPNAGDRGLRVFELSPGESPQEVIDRLRGLWNRGNRIEFHAPPKSESKDDDTEREQKATTETDLSKRRPRVSVWPPRDLDQEKLTTQTEADRFFKDITCAAAKESVPWESWPEARSVLTAMPDESSPRQELPAEDNGLPPVRFSVSSDGSLIVACDDKEALMQIEDLMKEVAKPAPKYRVYTLKYATPSWITLNLKEYFEAEEETETSMGYSFFYGYYPQTQKKAGAPSLGRRRIPTFIYDNFTSTILVRGADRRQLQIIDELIELYDVPEPADTRAMRITKIFRLENSKAEVVAQAVKDVFRDLLSSNDKALEKPGENKTQTRVYSYFGSDDGGDDDSPIRFKGLLSIGVDPNSDTLVVSSTASLMDTITQLVLELDKAGERSSSLQLIKVDRTVDLSIIQQRLNEALGNGSNNQAEDKRNKNGAKTGQGVPVGVQTSRGNG